MVTGLISDSVFKCLNRLKKGVIPVPPAIKNSFLDGSEGKVNAKPKGPITFTSDPFSNERKVFLY